MKLVGAVSIGFRSLGRIYEMAVSLGKVASYNGVLVDDIFADQENFKRYKGNLNGKIIVECSYYRKVYNESALIFNYLTDFKEEHNTIRVNFEDEKICWDYYNKFKNSHHTESIAGDWKIVNGNPGYQAECTIYSSRQIYHVR